MADPLSFAASIVGLLTVAGRVVHSFADVAKTVKNAPKNCEQTRAEVAEIRGILSQLQLFILGVASPSTSRTSLIMVEHVVVTLVVCVTTFSDLDRFVELLEKLKSGRVRSRFRWVVMEKELGGILSRLQLHKTSLSLILSILSW
jgi:hypothetical protein